MNVVPLNEEKESLRYFKKGDNSANLNQKYVNLNPTGTFAIVKLVSTTHIPPRSHPGISKSVSFIVLTLVVSYL